MVETEIEQVIEREDEIFDIGFELGTMQSGIASFTTEKINGELIGFFIDTDQILNVTITLDDMFGIRLFDAEITGKRFIALKVDSFNVDGELFNYGSERWLLNNRMRIEIKGGMNKNADFIVRWKNA